MADRVTRLAPSPTGALHLGNARTFLINWLLARQEGWRVVLRIDDLDSPRVKSGAAEQAIADLRWLGLDWDDGPQLQSDFAGAYSEAIQRLLSSGRAYPCVCSRSDVERAASAPHAEDGAVVYPGTCRGRFDSVQHAREAAGRAPAIRFDAGFDPIRFVDRFRSEQLFVDPQRRLGDFVIGRAMGNPATETFAAAYQLAVVIDDVRAGVTEVIRGDDLLDSTPRQILVYRALGLADRIPNHCHLPLVVGSDGLRLAKRHGDTRISAYRDHGRPAAEVLQLLAGWCGIEMDDTQPVRSVTDLIGRFELARLSPMPLIVPPTAVVLPNG